MEEPSKFPPIIELNVGGHHFTTTLLTLTKCKDNMLAAMFSGKYSVILDKDGRYFIDADGESFAHILNYLRYGEVPPPALAETVYREAAYFGVHGLVHSLEKYPKIMAQIQRNNFRQKFEGYSDCMDSIISAASAPTSNLTSDVKVLLYHTDIQQDDEDFNPYHLCICPDKSSDKSCTPDAKLGPWKSDSSEKEVLNCLVFDLESQGFIVTARYYDRCSYGTETAQCEKSFYNISFHWWKS